MLDITFIKYQNGTEAVLYSKFEMQTKDIKKKVHRIISEQELKDIKSMPLDKLKETVKRNLDNGTLLDND